MMFDALVIQPEKDNVAVVLRDILHGEKITVRNGSACFQLFAVTDIPIYHKIAIADFKKGDSVCKYGEQIGCASKGIPVGAHVDEKNLKSVLTTGN